MAMKTTDPIILLTVVILMSPKEAFTGHRASSEAELPFGRISIESGLRISYTPGTEREMASKANEEYSRRLSNMMESVIPVFDGMQKEYENGFKLYYNPNHNDTSGAGTYVHELTYFEMPDRIRIVVYFHQMPEGYVIDTLDNRLAKLILDPSSYLDFRKSKSSQLSSSRSYLVNTVFYASALLLFALCVALLFRFRK
jgi:hypothetical protein